MLKRHFFYLILILTLLVGISSSGVVAATVQELSIADAVKLALQKNLEVKIAALNLENAQIDYQKSQASNLLNESRYLQMQSELSLAQSQDVYLQTRNNVLINTVQNYYQLLLLELDQKIKAKEILLEKRLLEENQIQVQAGHLGHLDLLKQDHRYQNALFNLDKTQADEEQLLRKIKSNLGVDPTQEVRFTEFRVQPFTLSEEEALEQALNHSFTLQLRKGRWDLAKVDLERAKTKATPKLDLQKIENNLELARLEYEKTKEEIHQSIQNQYFLVQQAKERLALTEQTYQQSAENLEIVQKQKEVGLKTGNDLLMAELNLLQEDYARQTARMNELINQLQLKKLMGIKIEVSIREICK